MTRTTGTKPDQGVDSTETYADKVAAADAKHGEPVYPDEPVILPHLVLDLEGDRQQFPAYPHANQFLLVKHADALGEGGFATVLATTKLVVGQVLRDQRGAVEAYLEDHGGDPDYTDKLYASLTACWAGETNLPLAPSSVSSEPTATD
jgi:hypothetical protein